MILWIPITVVATVMQTVRFMLQKQLKSAGLSTSGAAFSRFVFGAPLAALVSGVALLLLKEPIPPTTGGFWFYVLAGGLAQIIATHMTVAILAMRNFAVGVAFTKTETVQVAIFAAIILGETVSLWGWVAIAIGFAGVLGLTKRNASGGLISRTTVYGVCAGGLFGLSAICYRGAALELGDGPAFLRAILTLACVTASQTLAMGAWMRVFEPGELTRVFSTWNRTVWVGITGMLGSLFWFWGFALQNAAYVRALGQIEMIFTLLVSWFVFKERLNRREGAGIALIVLSILILVLTL